jgi:hypothetical protein
MSSMNTQNQPTPNEQAPKNEAPLLSTPENASSLDTETSQPETPTSETVFSEQQTTSELVSKAQSFLESPDLKENNPESKMQYLVTKGLPEETADELQRAVSL